MKDKTRNKQLIYEVFGKKGVILCITITLLSTGVSILQPIVVIQYKNIINHVNSMNQSALDRTFRLVILSVILYEFLQLFLHLLTTVSEHLSIWLSYITSNEIQYKLHTKLDKIKYIELEKENTYNLISRISSSAADETVTTVTGFIGLFTGSISAIFYLFLLYSIKWYFPIFVISGIIVFFVNAQKQNKDKLMLLRNMEGTRRKMRYYQEVPLERKYIKDIMIFKLSDFFNEKAFALREEIEKEDIKLTINYIKKNMFVSMFKNSMWAVCILITALEAQRGLLGMGSIILVMKSMTAVIETIHSFNDNMKNIAGFIVLKQDWNTFFVYRRMSVLVNQLMLVRIIQLSLRM